MKAPSRFPIFLNEREDTQTNKQKQYKHHQYAIAIACCEAHGAEC
jgi:hypothetical protein